MTKRDDDERARRLLVSFKADLRTLAQRGHYGDFAFVVIAGLLDVTEALIRRAVRADATTLPNFLERLDTLRIHVVDVGARAVSEALPPSSRGNERVH